ncbi:MAG: GC-type dockerin domain-anchored protein [Phycisphaerales bacterium]
MKIAPIIVAAFASVAAAQNQPFEIVVTVTPPGSNSNPAAWQSVLRYGFGDSGAAPTALTSIPPTEVFDPCSAVFRTATDLFVGNRHGNVLGQGSISRFTVSGDGLNATFVQNFTAPNMVGVHELAISPTTGELFAATVFDGVFRFTFDNSGQPVYNGRFAQGVPMRGILVHPNGRYIYTTSASSVIHVYHIENDNSVTAQSDIAIPGASNLHFFCLGPSGTELYLGDISSNKVFRYGILPGGALVAKPAIDSPAAIDMAFSADGEEMFVGNHFQGGITRYAYNQGTDTWTQSGTMDTPSMGGFATYVRPPCGNTDLGKAGGLPGADGFLDNNDFIAFINYFFQNNPLADFGSVGGNPGSDGQYDNNDFIAYINQFFFGCF